VTFFSQTRPLYLSFSGPLEYRGTTPLDLTPSVVGRFSVEASGAGLARTQGVFFIPPAGAPPYILSEPRGMSAGLLVRALNFPGVPDISAHRAARGTVFVMAGSGAAFGAANKHLQYRDRLDEFGGFAAARAGDDRRARGSWLFYGAAVWGASALDYMIRPRFEIQESTPTRVTMDVSPASRGGALWRSLLVPGAGQEFANRPARGALWLGAALAAGAGIVAANIAVDRLETKAEWAAIYVDSAGPSERPQRLRELEVARNDVEQARDTRWGFGMTLAGIWVANLIDAAVMPLSPPTPGKPKVEASIPVGAGRAGVEFRYRF
jgi:hypothetical protein